MTGRSEAELVQLVRHRAGGRCEYCLVPETALGLKFQIDHVIARQHRGSNQEHNLAWTCTRCNSSKGPNLSGLDSETGALTRLFHPRHDVWKDHFAWRGPVVIGLTAIGRTTIHVLAINHPDAVAVRSALIEEGAFPSP